MLKKPSTVMTESDFDISSGIVDSYPGRRNVIFGKIQFIVETSAR